MKKYMGRLSFVLWLFTSTLTAATYHGKGRADESHLFGEVEVIVIYDEKGTSKISLRWGEKDRFKSSTFFITKHPGPEESLMGYFLFEETPVVVRFDTWSEDKEFYLYHPVIRPDAVFKGTFK